MKDGFLNGPELDCLIFRRRDERKELIGQRPRGSGLSLMSSDDSPLPDSVYVCCWFVCFLAESDPCFSPSLFPPESSSRVSQRQINHLIFFRSNNPEVGM